MSKTKVSVSPHFDGIKYKTPLGAAIAAAVGATPAIAQEEAEEAFGIEEITVTATKRAESINDLAMSIQAFDAEDITRQNLFSLEDYARLVPSMSYFGNSSGGGKVFFRGIADAPDTFIADSSAAIYLDEQPLTASAQVDVRLIDIERVEALSGPQGTLFGSSAQSGTLRIVTNKPDPSGFSAFADGLMKFSQEGDPSYDVSAMLNLPLVEDKLALRLVGFTATEGGFIDNVLGTTPICEAWGRCSPDGPQNNADVVEDDWNETTISGGRLAAKWFITDNWDLTLGTATQNADAKGENTYDPTVGDLELIAFGPDTRTDEWMQYSLTIAGDLGWADFTSATAYFTRDTQYTQDTTSYAAYFGSFCYDYTTTGTSGTTGVRYQSLSNNIYCFQPEGFGVYYSDPVGYLVNDQKNTSFSQEFRLVGQTERLGWVAGVFYEERTEDWDFWSATDGYAESQGYDNWLRDENTSPSGDFGLDPGTVYGGWGVPVAQRSDIWWVSSDRTDWETTAAFGELSFDFTESFNVTVGARWFSVVMEKDYWVELPENRFTPTKSDKHGCLITDGPCNVEDSTDATDDGISHPSSDESDTAIKVALEYNVNENIMVYGLYSEGFRPGGTNRNRGNAFFPTAYNSDYLLNTEFGFKGTLADGRVQLNLTYFMMDWKDYQLEVVDPSNLNCDNVAAPPAPNCGQPWQKVVTNVGQASSTGFEVAMQWVPAEGWDIGLNLAWLDAEVDEDLADVGVERGDTLPFAPHSKGSLFAQYTWPTSFFGTEESYLQATYAFVGDSLNQIQKIPIPTENFDFGNNAPQVVQEAYNTADLKYGLVGATWEANIFVRNLTDERGQVFHDVSDFEMFWVVDANERGRQRVSVIRPREIGLRFIKRWGN